MNATLSLARKYSTAHPREAAARLGKLPSEQVAVFLSGLDPAEASTILSELPTDIAAAVIERFEIERASRVLECLDLSRIVALLRALPADPREGLLRSLPKSLERRVSHALILPSGTVGTAADSTVRPFDADATVAAVRGAGVDPRLPYLYVIDREDRLVGVIHRRELDSSSDEAPLRSIMKTRVQSVNATDPMATIHDHRAWADLDALPVVDARGAFVGIIRHKSLRASPRSTPGPPGPRTAVSAVLDLGEVYWSGLYLAIETLAAVGTITANGETNDNQSR